MTRSKRWRARAWSSIGIAATVAVLGATAGTAVAGEDGDIRAAGDPDAIEDSYIVVFHDSVGAASAEAAAQSHAARRNAEVEHTYSAALRGYAAEMSERDARRAANDPEVAYVEQNTAVELHQEQHDPPSWGLDRIDQRELPLDGVYRYETTAPDVDAYILDTGISYSHNDFEGRAEPGYDAVGDGRNGDDCNGHGTHVAGTVGGAEHGVAKGVTLHSVRVLDCDGRGTNAGVIAGVDWVTDNHDGPSVANMSLGGGASSALDDAVRNSVNAGVTYAVASGNDDADACNYSPARVAEALTVNATTSSDARSWFSNYGTCTDIFAPGSDITSAWIGGDTATRTISGTSMAAPHVAGAAALYLADNPQAAPSEVNGAITSQATEGVVSNPGPGSPNRLVYTGATNDDPGDPDPEPETCSATNDERVDIPDNGPAVTSEITITDCDRAAAADAEVDVDIRHSWRGDVVIDLIAPDGTQYNLKQANFWDSGNDVRETYEVDLAAHHAEGTWTLRVQDVYWGYTGYLDSWSLAL
ncbi:S8 family serine peptidase [Haloechinothrix sp. LS1_15]|uniref:S8 family peptidase n=1 Tax=Haloechinothrix sp. LS1_15 TaxID=2652248 RepID=UPI0029481581|nr:S8 family serine peptidase [Haloechinothrix sp. LS1_15]MDV6011596.1 S8 family peptidase [Haloechinothrix sp. LS1_15]